MLTQDRPNFPASSPLQGARILVVDDRADDRAVLCAHLQRQGCRVYMAEDGNDGVLKALVVKPDLILMDISMPVCDGLTACQLLKDDAATREIPVIFLTGASQPQERVKGLMAGAIDYVTKPFDVEEIRLRLSIHLRDRERGTPIDSSTPPSASPLDQMLFMSARKYLRDNLYTTVDIATLSAAVNCSPRRINEAFRQCVGITALEYLREERMKHACALLKTTAMDVQDIATELGFTNGANFATAFKDRFGVSPTAFRRNQSEQTG